MSIVKQLCYKWFGLSDTPCETCEVLREQLHKSDSERRELLTRLLDKDEAGPVATIEQEQIPIKPQFTPWRVRQQLLEAEDRKKAELLRRSTEDIQKLEKELEIAT